MVRIPTVSGGGAYCIDATEVTVGAYTDFLDANPALSLLPASCSGKTSYTPSVTPDSTKPTYPIAHVDWCDAYVFCAFEGKHLCGRIGGGLLGANDPTDATKSEWQNACSMGGAQVYPYAGSYDAGACVDISVGAVGPVGALATCVGGFPGLHDMSGNLQEWEDNCILNGAPGSPPSLQDRCRTRGGGYNDGATAVTCASMLSTRRRNQTDSATGFRCCR